MSERRAWPILLGVGFLSLLVPVLLVDIPPVLDFPNHLARLWLIAGGGSTPPLSDMFVVDWSHAATNIGIDLMALLFGGALGAALVTKACLAASILLPSLGGFLLHRRVFGGTHIWQLAFLLPAFGKTTLAGFMNFNIAVGLGLLGAALDEHLARRGPVLAFVIRALVAGVILLFHPFGTLAYAGLLLALSLGRELPDFRSLESLLAKVRAGLMVIVPTVLPVLLVMALATHPPVVAETGRALMSWASFSITGQLGMLLTAYRGYMPWLDLWAVALTLSLVGWAAARRLIEVHVGLLLAGLSFGLLALVAPVRIGDVYWVEARAPVIATFTLLASVRPIWRVPRFAMIVASALFLTGMFRTGVVGAAWLRGHQDIDSVRAVLARVPVGASVLPTSNMPDNQGRRTAPLGRYFADNPAFWSYPALAVIERQSFVPTLWTVPGQHPLRVLDPWRDMSGPFGGLPVFARDLTTSELPAAKAYLRNWRQFDYVLHLNADLPISAENALPKGDLDLVEDRGFAVLYRVRHRP